MGKKKCPKIIIADCCDKEICPHERINPPTVFTPPLVPPPPIPGGVPAYSQVVVTTGTTQYFLAGQVPKDINGNVVGIGQPNDIEIQTTQTMENIKNVLQYLGLTFANVARMNMYFRSDRFDPGLRQRALPIIFSYFPPDQRPATTAITTPRLADPNYLLEITIDAVSFGPCRED